MCGGDAPGGRSRRRCAERSCAKIRAGTAGGGTSPVLTWTRTLPLPLPLPLPLTLPLPLPLPQLEAVYQSRGREEWGKDSNMLNGVPTTPSNGDPCDSNVNGVQRGVTNRDPSDSNGVPRGRGVTNHTAPLDPHLKSSAQSPAVITRGKIRPGSARGSGSQSTQPSPTDHGQFLEMRIKSAMDMLELDESATAKLLERPETRKELIDAEAPNPPFNPLPNPNPNSKPIPTFYPYPEPYP